MAIVTNPEYVRKLETELFEITGKNKKLQAKYNAAHAELVQIMHILHCVAEAPPPSMEQTIVVRGVCELADRVRKADDRVRVLTDAATNVLPFIVTQVVACHGLKCREAICTSCSEDAYTAAQEAGNAYNVLLNAINATVPPLPKE